MKKPVNFWWGGVTAVKTKMFDIFKINKTSKKMGNLKNDCKYPTTATNCFFFQCITASKRYRKIPNSIDLDLIDPDICTDSLSK